MKSLKIIIAVFIAVFCGVNSMAQMPDHSKMNMTKTETFKVLGNCDLCKARIEKAAKIDGVSKAEWNKTTKVLTLVYNSARVNSNDVLKKVAAAGHDSDKFKADGNVYQGLPGCCQYSRK